MVLAIKKLYSRSGASHIVAVMSTISSNVVVFNHIMDAFILKVLLVIGSLYLLHILYSVLSKYRYKTNRVSIQNKS